MEYKFKCTNGVVYTIDTDVNNISKSTPKGDQQLSYNDFTKMYLDFNKIKLSEEDSKAIQEYLIAHPFTTFTFCSFNKEKFQPKDTVESIVEKLAKKPNKLLSTFASSILFLQTQNVKYEQLPASLENEMSWRFNTFNTAFNKYGLKTYDDFPAVSYNDFLRENQVIYRNSSSVEQTLKLINLDPKSFVYLKTKKKWDNYLLGKNSQLSFKQAFPILNLTCTYSLYKINYKDKEFEDNLKRHVEFINGIKDNYEFRSLSTNEQVFQTTYGQWLFHKVLDEKINNNPSFKNRPQIVDYLKNKFDYVNYTKNPEQEQENMLQWLMKNEGSDNRDLYKVEVSEIIKHNIDHCFGKIKYLTNTYNKELSIKPGIPQELQKFCSSSLSRNMQTPKVYEQVRQVLDSNASDEQKAKIINFFHFLNKTAMYEFNDSHNMNRQNREVQLSELFSRYFSSFGSYVLNGSATVEEVSKILTFLISQKDTLPNWLLTDMVAADEGINNRNSSFHNFKDNVEQILAIDKYLKKPLKDYYTEMYESNARDRNIYEYVQQLESLPKFSKSKKSQTIKYVSGTDYNIFKWFKSTYESGNTENLHENLGKFLCDYTGTSIAIKSIKDLKSIKQIKPDEVGRYAGYCKDTQKNLASLLEEKEKETKTVRTYLTIIKKHLTGEALAKELADQPMLLSNENQIVCEDENYTCFIPSFEQCAEWGDKMHNCIKWCYLPHYKNGEGVFLFICKKGQFHTPLNATHLALPSRYSYGWNNYGDSDSIARKIEKNQEYNDSTENKKSKNFGKPKVGLLSGLACNQCYSNAIDPKYGQPKIYELEQEGHQLQTPLEREQLYAFCNKMRKELGFDGASWFEDFDRKMDEYFKSIGVKKSNVRSH